MPECEAHLPRPAQSTQLLAWNNEISHYRAVRYLLCVKWVPEMLNIGVNHFGVDCSFNTHRCPHPVEAQCANDRDPFPSIERFQGFGPFSFQGTGVTARQCCVNAKFINEDQSLYGEPFLPLFECGSLDRISFSCPDRLFLRENPRFLSARQIVVMLASTRAFFFNYLRNSSSVASGILVTRVDKTVRWSASS